MAHQTEAACLLETGALYATRVLLRPRVGVPIFAGFKAGAFSLYFGDAPIYHVDRDGRWQRAFIEGTHYLKGLDTTVRAIDRVREGANLVLRRRTLGFAEASDLDALVRGTAIDLLAALGEGIERVDPPAKGKALDPEALREILERIARWDAAAWFAQREDYLAAYGPLPFLPPDCQNAVVLQATLGHAGGLAFGQGKPEAHGVRSPEEFERHARAVAALLGRRRVQCRAVFLGGGDVLRRPPCDVAAYLEATARVFPVGPGPADTSLKEAVAPPARPEAIHAFLDHPTPPRVGRDAWRRFRALHLGRVSIGLESGDPAVRALYGKGWADEDLVATVADLKAEGIGVGVVVLANAGGREHDARHIAATAALINALPLGTGDLVSLLDADEVRDPARVEPHLSRMDDALKAEQLATLREALRPVRAAKGAKVVPYNLEKQGG